MAATDPRCLRLYQDRDFLEAEAIGRGGRETMKRRRSKKRMRNVNRKTRSGSMKWKKGN